MDPCRLWSLQQLATELGVHARTLRDAARRGRLEVTYGNRVVFRNPVPRATLAAGRTFLERYYRHSYSRFAHKPRPPGRTRHDALAAFFESFPPLSGFRVEQTEVDGAGGLAYVWGSYSLKMSPADAEAPISDSGKYIEIWRKQADGTWRVALDIFNSDLPIPGVEVPESEK